METYVVVNQGRHDTNTMLTSLENRPVNSIESLLVVDAQRRHNAQRVANRNTQSLTSNGVRAHRLERVHDLCYTAEGRVAGIEWSIERLTGRWNHILIEAEPVDVRTTRCPWRSIEHELGTFTVHIGVSLELGFEGLNESVEDLSGEWV